MKKVKFLALLLAFIFSTPPNVSALQSTVNLLTADSFAVLGASAVTNTGSSVITGNLGVSPGTAITGFPPGAVTGTIHSADAPALQAQNDLTTAYNDAANRPCDTDLTGQDLGGLTLMPGVYCFESSAQLTGTLTLNGQGNSDAVFIFKMGSTITTASGSSVSLINSAQACNVFWQTGSSATLGTTTNFKGNILALTSITLNTSATVTGRVLARNGAVTLDSNTVSRAICTAPTLTPTPTISTTPTPTPTSDSTTTPTSTPTSTSVSTSDSNSGSNNNSNPGVETQYCPPLSNQIVVPIIIESKRVDADSIFISWGPYSGTDTFNVQYSFENGQWLYNTDVTGFSATINALHLNQPIWVRIAARNNCQIGVYGESKLVGGPSLPNTGFAPQNKNIFFVLTQIKNWLLGL